MSNVPPTSISPRSRDSRQSSKKAYVLLEARGVRWFLCDMASRLATTDVSQLWQNVLGLQASIYELDRRGEESWSPAPTGISEAWAAINAAASPFRGSVSLQRGMRRIHGYQCIEASLRIGKPLSAIPIAHFYDCKICDVSLVRELIASGLGDTRYFDEDCRFWRMADVVGEVLDDARDIGEDVKTTNGNRLLWSIAEIGLSRTVKDYACFVRILEGELADNLRGSAQVPLTICRQLQSHLEEVAHILKTLPSWTLDEIDRFAQNIG